MYWRENKSGNEGNQIPPVGDSYPVVEIEDKQKTLNQIIAPTDTKEPENKPVQNIKPIDNALKDPQQQPQGQKQHLPLPPGSFHTPSKPKLKPAQPPQSIIIPLPNLPAKAKPLEMVLIPAGTFLMGSPDNEKYRHANEGPQHKVTISKPFYLGKYQVTQAQWKALMGSNPSISKGDNLPVQNVSWNDCQDFIERLNRLGQGTFRLPTEAEWEYACRAGTTTRRYWGSDDSDTAINDYAWYEGNSKFQTHPVGQKRPNAWNLFDMQGNVWEWCQDWYGAYPSSAQTDPQGPNSGESRVISRWLLVLQRQGLPFDGS